MKRLLTALLIVIGLAGLAMAQLATTEAQKISKYKLKDVPDDHWAAAAVYDLVNLGVTKGFPDGTYRGNKPINRYEIAIFLSKLAKSIGTDNLKADISDLRNQVVELKKTPADGLVVTGEYQGYWKLGNVFARQGGEFGGVADFRLIVNAEKKLSDDAGLKINFDTMDYGYFDDGTGAATNRGGLTTDLLAVESNVTVLPWQLKLTYGPGPQQHLADPTGFLPSEVGYTYVRPTTGIQATTDMLGGRFSGGYYSLQGTTLETSGKINTSQLSGTMSYTFKRFLFVNNFRVDLTGDYFSHGLLSSTDRNLKAKVDLLAGLGDKAEATGSVGLGRTTDKMMVAGGLALKDPWDTGTVLTINLAKIGANYITQTFSGMPFYYAGYDQFNRPLENGTVNLGGQLVQQVADKTQLIGKGDLRLGSNLKYEGEKARLTVQGGLVYNLAPHVNLDAAYRVNQDKGTGDTSDLASVGLLYRF